jgi:hypothetical protein
MRLIFDNQRFMGTVEDNDMRIRMVAEVAGDGSLIYYRQLLSIFKKK